MTRPFCLDCHRRVKKMKCTTCHNPLGEVVRVFYFVSYFCRKLLMERISIMISVGFVIILMKMNQVSVWSVLLLVYKKKRRSVKN